MKLNRKSKLKSKIRKLKIPYSDIEKIVNAIKAKKGQIKLIGGIVRDVILDQQKSREIDLVTNIQPQNVIECLESHKIEYLKIGFKYGCVTAKINGELIEITSLRKDIMNDGRWPVVQYTRDWKEDAKRRDFTINAIYLDFNGEIFDPQNGIKDLKNNTVVFIGNPVERVKEDYLRILRFFRFTFLYSKKFDEESLKACIEYKKYLKKLSLERRSKEILKILILKNFEKNFFLLYEHGFFKEIFEVEINTQNVKDFFQIERELENVSEIRRIKFLFQSRKSKFLEVLSKKDLKRITNNFNIKDYSLNSVKKIIYVFGKDNVIDKLIFDASDKKLTIIKLKKLINFVKTYIVPKLPLNGYDIKKLGFSEDRIIGDLKKEVEMWWIEKGLIPTKKECIIFLKSLPTCKGR